MDQKVDKSIGYTVRLNTDFTSAVEWTVQALKAEGFGVLTEIDVRDTFKQKLGVDVPPYKILGACNPPLAHRALTAAPEVGLLLPCNVTVRETESGEIEVALVDPITMLGVVSNEAVQPVAEEAAAKLKRVRDALAASI